MRRPAFRLGKQHRHAVSRVAGALLERVTVMRRRFPSTPSPLCTGRVRPWKSFSGIILKIVYHTGAVC